MNRTRRFAAALAWACALAAPAWAGPSPVGYTAPDGVNAVAVTAATPLPITGAVTITPGAAPQPANITQVNGAALAPGNPLPASPVYGPSGVTAVSASLTAAGATGALTPVAGRGFHVQLSGTASATCYLERQLDGATWAPITVTAGGVTTPLYNWIYAGAALTEDVVEAQFGAAYRVDCGAQLGAFASGTLAVRLSQ